MTGTVKKIVLDRGFGFIRPDDGSPDVFFHIKDVDQASLPWDEQLTQQRVRFEIVSTGGKERARAVRADG